MRRWLRSMMLQEWLAAGVALTSCLLLLLLVPRLVAQNPDLPRLTARAVSNFGGMARIQLGSWLGVSLVTMLLLYKQPWTERLHLAGVLLRATLPLLLMIAFHQSIPLWQRVAGLPEADAVLMRADEWLFGGTNPVLWLEQWISAPLTEYMWAVYLAWFMAFQGTIYLLAITRSTVEWSDMVLASVLTLTFGYMLYILVPAVGPVHFMKAMFTMDLYGGPTSQVTTGLVDRFGVWRDAFPSIHAAISTLLMVYAWRYLKRWAGLYTLFGVSVLVSTVYLRWHYVTDVLAGMALAVACALLAQRLVAAHSTTDTGDTQPQTPDRLHAPAGR